MRTGLKVVEPSIGEGSGVLAIVRVPMGNATSVIASAVAPAEASAVKRSRGWVTRPGSMTQRTSPSRA